MFSYLRPHRRTPSNPTSPVPEQSHSWEPPIQPSEHAHLQRLQDATSQESSPNLTSPPILPPITQVSSAAYEPTSGNKNSRAGVYERNQRTQQWEASKGDTRGRDLDTRSNRPRNPTDVPQRPGSAGNVAPTKHTSFQNTSRPQTGFTPDVPSRQPPPPPSEQALPFVTSPDLQSRPVLTGRRPTGARLPTPPSGSNPVSTFEPVQPRSGKARLNLLNPMFLLARRRTSQTIPQLSAESLVTNRTKSSSATFDPRIRGTVVHDFSAPRVPKRNVSYNDIAAAENTQRSYRRSPNPQYVEASTDDVANGPWSGGNHTPVFTENFEEEQYPAAGPHVRKANDLSDLPLPKPPYAKGAQKPIDQTLSLENDETAQKQLPLLRNISERRPIFDVGPPVPPKLEGEVPQPRRISIDPAATPPKLTTSSKKGPSRNVSGVSAKDPAVSGLPKHMKSTSSRFSFDMIGAAEQERLLEDRHRQRALEKKNEKGDDPYDEEEGDYDYDDMMDDDGLEERIPGVNADLEEEDDLDDLLDDDDDLEERIPGVNVNAEDDDNDEGIHDFLGFTFQQSNLASPVSPYGPGRVSTPRDANGQAIGFAFTKDSPQVSMVQDSPASTPISPDARMPALSTELQGLGLQGVATSSPTEVHQHPDPAANVSDFPHASGIDDDDLYFDDGIIDEIADVEYGMEFDESIFDNVDTDQYGRPMKSFSSLPTLYSPPLLTTDPSPSFNKIPEADENNIESLDVSDIAASPGKIPAGGALAPKPSVLGKSDAFPITGTSQVLTQDTLAAYQSALAAAAHAAAANGKFNRRDSTTPDVLSPASQIEPNPGLVHDSSQTSHCEPFSPSYEFEDDFDYDDNLEDDPIIAAANAEALANDCDGFYGQEFGFYSAPAASEAEFVNGGYFGPRGADGVMRSQSGRMAFRAPNLTPITERSEYSNRNSFMSLSMHGPGSVTSPGLAQLAGMMSNQDFEGDMSLNALLKLRRGAWGGSQASLHSSTGSPRSAGGAEDISPVGGLPPWAQGGVLNTLENTGVFHRRKNSGYSIGAVSEIDISGMQSEDESRPGSPTLTMAGLARTQSQTQTSASPEARSGGSKSSDKEREAHSQSPKNSENGIGKEVRKHRYTGSAESISYLKEDDPLSPTGERWVLERRRTAESGEVEFVGREVVSGGRI